MSDLLPPELYQVVLLKLPIKSLIKCTSVCKLWRSIITSPAFISGHLSLSRQNPLLLTAGTHNPNTFALNFDTDPPLRLSQTLPCPFPTYGDGRFRAVGSVDGLILLSDDLHGTLVLWNPSIRKSVTLPDPRFHYDEDGQYTFGFGVDSASGDYKVVRIRDLDAPPLLEVFSLRDQSWRTVISTIEDYVVLACGQCFIHGAVHWIGLKMSHRFDSRILLFDLGKDEFKKMALPEDENEWPPAFSMSVMIGRNTE